jgi:two-component sensor histidine kinase
LTVADDGVGMREAGVAILPEKRGSDYVAIFVRQLGGTLVVSGPEGVGTTIRIRFPLSVIPPAGAAPLAA